MKRLLLNSGFTMTEMMVGLGLMGGISMVTMKVMQEQSQNEAQIRFQSGVNKAAMMVQQAVSNNTTCNQMLAGKTRDTTMWPNTGTSGAIDALTYGGQTLLKDDQEYAEGFYIPDNGILLAEGKLGGSTGANVTELIIIFKTRNKVGSKNNPTIKATAAANQNTIVKRIPFLATMNGTVIKACGPVVSDADIAAKKTMCDGLGSAATWNAGTSTCTLNAATCPAGQIPIEVASLGNVNCMPATQADMTEIFDFNSATCAPGQSVTLRSDAVTGKIKAVCVGAATGCPSQILTWKVGENSCRTAANSGTGVFNVTSVAASDVDAGATDLTSPGTGTATFFCSDGKKAWVITGSPTCNVTAKNCVGTPANPIIVRWSGASKFCSYSTAPSNVTYTHKQQATVYAQSAISSAGVNTGTSRVTFECINGVISVINSSSTPNFCD